MAPATDSALGPEAVLDELEGLAAIEHALVVEFLTVSCALGHDLEAAEGGATTEEGRAAAGEAFNLALGAMFALSRIARVLSEAGRGHSFDRATAVTGGAHGDVALDPPTAAELERLLEREEAIAAAVDARAGRLQTALASSTGLAPEVLDELRGLAEAESGHVAALAPLREALAGVTVAGVLRATRREPADPLERRLLDIGERSYRVVVVALQERFAPGSTLSQSLAVGAMTSLDEVTRALVQRGLLPSFS